MSVVTPKPRRRFGPAILFAILPMLTLAYQLTAKTSANQLAQARFDLSWLATAASMPSVQLLVALEIAAFVAWMKVLSEMPLSAAFPLSAVSYVLIIGASVVVLHEPLSLLQVIGGLAILLGVLLIGYGAKTDEADKADGS